MGRRREQREPEEQATVGELMFARSVIEEKNEIIDQKDQLIRELASQLRAVEADADDLRTALARSARSRGTERAEERQSAESSVVLDVVRAVADWEDVHGPASTGATIRVLSVLQEKYGLRIIEETPVAIDPELHHVVEVDHSSNGEGSIEVLSRGYRIGNMVIRPALVKVAPRFRPVPSPHGEVLNFDRQRGDRE